MNTKDYQLRLLSQIGFTDLSQSIINYQKNPNQTIFENSYFLSSNVLVDSLHGNLINLIEKLLFEMKIPEIILNFLRDYFFSNGKITNQTWDYFYDFTFEGVIKTTTGSNKPLGLQGNFLFEVVGPDFFLDIISKPINALIGVVEHFVKIWKKLRENNVNSYYLPKHHDELFIYIESEIAGFYGCPNVKAVAIETGTKVFNGYRFLGVIDSLPFKKDFFEICKISALKIAKSTYE